MSTLTDQIYAFASIPPADRPEVTITKGGNLKIKRIPPTVAEHLAFGRAVKQFAHALNQMVTGTPSGLGVWRYPKTSRQAKALHRVQEALVQLKSRDGQRRVRRSPDERQPGHPFLLRQGRR
jgi:hypothetical protein